MATRKKSENQLLMGYTGVASPTVRAINCDDTEPKRAEEALRESEQRLDNILQRSPIPAFVIGKDHKVTYWNKALEELSGIRAEEMIGTNQQWRAFYNENRPCLADLLVDEEIDAIPQWYEDKYTKSKLIEEAYEATDFFPALGERGRWLHFTAAIIRNSEGNLIGALETLEDITGQKRADETLRQSEQWKTILNQIATIFLTIPDEEMYGKVLAVVLQAMKSKFGTFGYIGDNGDLIIPSLTREIWSECRVPGKSIVFPSDTWGESLWGRAIREKKAFYSDGPFRTPEGHVQIDHFLAVPIVFGKETIGLLSVANKEGSYTEEDKELQESIAKFISPILNARLQRDRQERERKRAEEALRESEEKYRVVVENAKEAIFVAQDGMLKFVNRAGEEISGYSREEFTSRPFADFIHPDDREMITGIYEKRLRGEPLAPVLSLRVIGKDGNTKWVETNAATITWNGKSAALYFVRDITERRLAEEALRQSEERYRTILENTEEGYYEVDLAGNFTFFNDALCRLYGYPREELMGMNNRQYMDQETAKRVFREYNQVYKTGKPRRLYDFELVLEDGSKRYVEVSISLQRDSSGEATGFRGIVRDIAERKRAEEALRQSEERYRTILEDIEEGYFEVDLAGNFTFVTDVLCRRIGYSREELIGMNYRVFTDPKTIEKVFQAYNELYRTGRPIRGLDGKVMRKNGTEIIHEVSASLIRDSEGRPIGFRGTSRDITERKRAEEALRQSEERYRTILDNIEEAYFEDDLGGNFTFVNNVLCRLLGYSRQELIGMNFRQYTDPDNYKKLRELYGELYKTGKPVRAYDLEAIRKDGTKKIYETSVSLLRDAEGKRIGFRGLSRDVTERKRAEAALREGEQRLKIILQGSPVSAFILDSGHNVIHWNKALEELSGMKAEEVIGTKEHWKAFYPEERPCLADLLIDGHAEEIPQWFPGKWAKSKLAEGAYEGTDFYPGLGKGGRWLHFTAATIRDSLGEIVGVIETFEDITERKQAEDRLRESESRFRDLVENALIGIYIMQDGQIVYKNSEQDRILGPLPRPYNFNDFKNVHPEDVEKVKGLYKKMMSGEISNFDADMRFFPGGEMDDTADMRWVQARAREIEYQGGKATLINMMDITRARELEHLMRVDDKMTSLGRAAAGIIHELRNPLSGINVYLTALKKIYNQPDKIEPESFEKIDEVIKKMQSASNKIESVIKRVMDFSKPSIPRLAPTNINHSIQEAIGLSSATLRKLGIQIETSLRDDLPQCFTDSHLIEEVLLNLIMNASQAMENTAGEKIIEITSSVEGSAILIGVADSGPGVPPVLRKKIFDPFFTTKKDSSGIGLSVCHRIIADHGGSLSVLTSKWGGAEFRVEIPIEKRKGVR